MKTKSGKLNYYIANAGGRLTPYISMIDEAVKKAEEKVLPLLGIDWGIDINFIVSEQELDCFGIRAYTPTRNYIQIWIDPKNTNEIFAEELLGTLSHEISHTKRYTKMNYVNEGYNMTVLDYLIFEGLATAFEIEIVGKDTYYIREEYRKRNKAKEIEQIILPYYDKNFDFVPFNKYWFYGDKENNLPVRAGYELGLYIVEKYMKKSGKKASELFSVKPEEFVK